MHNFELDRSYIQIVLKKRAKNLVIVYKYLLIHFEKCNHTEINS